jgi:hypothetical protein
VPDGDAEAGTEGRRLGAAGGYVLVVGEADGAPVTITNDLATFLSLTILYIEPRAAVFFA